MCPVIEVRCVRSLDRVDYFCLISEQQIAFRLCWQWLDFTISDIKTHVPITAKTLLFFDYRLLAERTVTPRRSIATVIQTLLRSGSNMNGCYDGRAELMGRWRVEISPFKY